MRRPPIPPAAPLLLAAAALAALVPSLAPSARTVERIATVALVVILFDGGASIGVRRLRTAIVPVLSLGLPGTFATAGLLTVLTHFALGTSWLTAGLLGAAIAPTDPAVMFSVLGDRRIEGRTDTILEGESGANDPVGIALMLGLVHLATHPGASFWVVVEIFSRELAIGLAVGIAGGLAAAVVVRRLDRGAAVVRLALAGAIFEVANLLGGSGFLAVFVAGLMRGDVEGVREDELVRFRERLSTVAEVTVFVALGLTVHARSLSLGLVGSGLLLAAFVTFLARPIAGALLLAPVRLGRGERAFVLWGGLKGAVPILLAAYAVENHVAHAQRIYQTVFVVVLASVLVQGGSLPWAARRFGVEEPAG